MHRDTREHHAWVPSHFAGEELVPTPDMLPSTINMNQTHTERPSFLTQFDYPQFSSGPAQSSNLGMYEAGLEATFGKSFANSYGQKAPMQQWSNDPMPTSHQSPYTSYPYAALTGNKRSATRWEISGIRNLLDVVVSVLVSSNRQKRNWKECSVEWNKVHRQLTNDDLKMKVKQLLRERPNRVQTRFWKSVKNSKSKEEIRERLAEALRTDDQVQVEWPLDKMAAYLFDKHPRGYLSIYTWEKNIQKEIADKLVELHKTYGGRFVKIHKHVSQIFTLFDVEYAVLSHCSCVSCQKWG